MKISCLVYASVAALAISAPASAAVLNFDVFYSGGNVAALAPGSLDMFADNLFSVGDTVNYTFTAVNGSWTALQAGPVGFLSFGVLTGANNNFTGSYNYTNSYKLGAATIFTQSQSETDGAAHLGLVAGAAFPSGITFDQFSLTAVATARTSSPIRFAHLFPAFIGGANAPEVAFPAFFSFEPGIAAVPEPASWALMIAGFGLVGSTMRRRKPSVSVRFA